ncbi:MAG: trypsin-like peptidase domain-containing protein [Rhodospirillales bacterium]|nr:trypsin-like peptidase domain-containing protein [Rhodospirillales bacterium]
MRWRVLALGLLWAVPALAFAQFSLFQGAPQSLAPLVKLVAPSVVGITVTELSGGQGGKPAPLRAGKATPPLTEAAGSGLIISSDGLIVTNDHVIAGAAQITVTLDNGKKLIARLVGADDLTDIAVIRIRSSQPLQPAHWANSAKVQIGDWVLAAGNPFALGNSFTLGIISAEGRDIGEGPFNHFLQLDAPINPGNSGGPAFNMEGGVIGINSAIVSPSGGSVGIGFAIPSNSAAPIVAQLIAHGAVVRGWLGVSVEDPQDGTPGAEIAGLEPGGPADEAGLSQSDVIVTVNGEAISGADGLTRAIASMAPGRKVVLGVQRNAHIFHLPVIVGRRPVQIGE